MELIHREGFLILAVLVVIIYTQAQSSFQQGSNLAAIIANSKQAISFHKGYKSQFTRT